MSPFKKALRLAKKIPSGSKSKAKSKAVHAWAIAIKEMVQKGHA